jgi:hypothetical protein
MNGYEITLHGTDSIYVLASTKYRALELAGDLLGRCRSAGHTPVRRIRGASV